MICYQLHCVAGHEFESWFPSGDSYECQRESGLISCPQCGSPHVDKSLMAPAVGRKSRTNETPVTDEKRAALHTLRAHIEFHCDNVGERFAEEALKRHDAREGGNSEQERGIYGTMSNSERERLEDAGVDFTAIPWIERSDA